MPRELLILRHGKSDWDVTAGDFNRPLKDRGKRGAQRIGTWLAQQERIPDLIISSPAERAKVTAQKCAKSMGLDERQVTLDPRIYEASSSQLVELLEGCPDSAQRVMIVGHNPGFETLLDYLSNEPLTAPKDGKLLPTATLAQLEMPDDWKSLGAGCAQLTSLTRPGSLPEKFPFPGPDGSELRDRPSYYYSQSSVIPYQYQDGQLHILIISSSKKKHWVVPKGIKDPGKTPQESAAKEAEEEAGIIGNVASDALGSYQYEKWGATCTVTVYPMEVTEVIPEEEWEEAHRGRQWVTPEKAINRVKQQELVPMIEALATQLGQSEEGR